MIKVFLSRPNWVQRHVANHLKRLDESLASLEMKSHTIGTNVDPLASPFDEVVALMKSCDCTIVLGLPQIKVCEGTLKGEAIKGRLVLPTEWNHIEAAISIMLQKPTLMMLPRGVAAWGLFERGAANVFVHEFTTMGPKWVEDTLPKLKALKERINAQQD